MRLSQHFLIDERVAERQIQYADLTEDDVVLEIGAGNGFLTKRIARYAKVVAIELDDRFIERLKKIPNVEVVHGNALHVDFGELEFNKVISNIPYHISSQLTFKLLERTFDVGILMYQREFAERMVAPPHTKSYSRLTVMTYYRADCRILEHVPRECFRPVPKVDSCVVKMVPLGKRFEVNEELFETVVRALFSHRRKTVKNALAIEDIAKKDEVEEWPEASKRVEELSPEQIAALCRKIEEMK
ncbi:MAG TPA: ribosomal RNA small subunit methyltransferase A [Thermoplasmatales archaeon]|nr:MAG: ribosomal RNA small subunit methyltransferase A [Thermoplasmata archaeon]RLF34169.1 MAG: ribosomal RNA small subunit methyltransferase A [Thermoplasmata archaeon]HDN50310.1 ribosomal RNA small subunit methyltransferase A [Thermoplasmatales archaeon]